MSGVQIPPPLPFFSLPFLSPCPFLFPWLLRRFLAFFAGGFSSCVAFPLSRPISPQPSLPLRPVFPPIFALIARVPLSPGAGLLCQSFPLLQPSWPAAKFAFQQFLLSDFSLWRFLLSTIFHCCLFCSYSVLLLVLFFFKKIIFFAFFLAGL